MSVSQVVQNRIPKTLRKRVYYIGTDTLLEGYCLCYNWDADGVDFQNASTGTTTASAGDWADARRICVEKPNESNKIHFAGVVAPESHGASTGWITIFEPGSVCNVYAYSNCDHGSTGITTATGQIICLVPLQYYMQDGGFPGTGAATVLQDEDRSSTAGVVMAELQTGPPSGGVQYIDLLSTATAGALSVSMSAVPIYHGVYKLIGDVAATISVGVGTTAQAGKWIGQTFQLGCYSAPTTATYSLFLSGVKLPLISAGAGGCIAALNGTGELSLATENFTARWDGTNWNIVGVQVISVTFA